MSLFFLKTALLTACVVAATPGPWAADGKPDWGARRRVLLNDTTAWHVQAPGTSFRIHVAIMHGSVFDPVSHEGTAALTAAYVARLVEEGLKADEGVGGELKPVSVGWTVSADSTEFVMEGPSDEIAVAGRAFLSSVADPVFDEKRLAAVKEPMLLGLLQREDSPDRVAESGFRRLLFEPFAYASDPSGTAATVRSVELGDVIRCFRRTYLANRALVVISSPMGQEAFREFTGRYLGRWLKGDAPTYDFARPTPASRPRSIWWKAHGADWTSVVVGVETFRRKNDDYYALKLAAGWLSENVKTLEAGFPGHRFSVDLQSGLLSGYMAVKIAVPPASDPALPAEGVARLMARLIDLPVPRDAFNRLRSVLEDAWKKDSTTPEGFARLLMECEKFRLGVRAVDDISRQLDSVIPEDLNFVMEKYWGAEKLKSAACGAWPAGSPGVPPALRPADLREWRGEEAGQADKPATVR